MNIGVSCLFLLDTTQDSIWCKPVMCSHKIRGLSDYFIYILHFFCGLARDDIFGQVLRNLPSSNQAQVCLVSESDALRCFQVLL